MKSSWIGQGFRLVGWSESDGHFYVIARLTQRAWFGMAMSLPEVLKAEEDMANLNSARCSALAPTKRECVEQLAKMQGFRPL
jgi:hypothetical protein